MAGGVLGGVVGLPISLLLLFLYLVEILAVVYEDAKTLRD